MEVARRVLGDGGFDATVVVTTGPGHAAEATRHACAEGAELVVAWGGDGTMNEVARVLAFGAVPLALVPAGSGNGLARDLGVPRESAGGPRRRHRRPAVAHRRRRGERGPVLQRGRSRSRRAHRPRVRRQPRPPRPVALHADRHPRAGALPRPRVRHHVGGGHTEARAALHRARQLAAVRRPRLHRPAARCSTTAGSTWWSWTTCRCGGC